MVVTRSGGRRQRRTKGRARACVALDTASAPKHSGRKGPLSRQPHPEGLAHNAEAPAFPLWDG